MFEGVSRLYLVIITLDPADEVAERLEICFADQCSVATQRIIINKVFALKIVLVGRRYSRYINTVFIINLRD